MKVWHRRMFNTLSAVVTATGIVYFWMKYLLISDDPLAVVNHPLQPLMLDLHLLSAPVLLVIFGVVLNAHVASKFASGLPSSRSGLTSLATFAVMALTGYLLQVIVNENTHLVLLWLHIGTGLVFAASYTFHFVTGVREWHRVSAGARSPS